MKMERTEIDALLGEEGFSDSETCYAGQYAFDSVDKLGTR